jgi:putative transport protein
MELRAFRSQAGRPLASAPEAEALVPDARVFVLRLRRNGVIEEAAADTVLREGDVVAIAGLREVLVKVIGANAAEVEDPELLNVPVEGVDVYVTNKAVDGKTLIEVARLPGARGVFLRKITRGAVATSIPILPNTIQRGDLLTVGRTQDTATAAKMGVADRPTDVADVAFIGAAIVLGALVGSLVFKVKGVPLTLSTAGGALVAGIVFGWLRSVRPLFGRIPSPTVWFMNSVGLNIFIAIVGISAGPGFVNGLKTQGGLFCGAPCDGPRRSSSPARSASTTRCAWRRLRRTTTASPVWSRHGQEPGAGARLHRHHAVGNTLTIQLPSSCCVGRTSTNGRPT